MQEQGKAIDASVATDGLSSEALIDIQRKSRVLQYRSAVEQNVIANRSGRADPDLNSPVGRS